MKIVIVKNYDEMSLKGAEVVLDTVLKNKEAKLGLATGSTPVGMYKCLIEDFSKNNTDYSLVKTYNLDEYVGLGKNHEQSYYHFMLETFFKHVNINLNNVSLPNGLGDVLQNAKDFENKVVSEGPVDLQVLGLGSNGHIAFNEPGTPFDSVTHVIELQEATINDNARFFENQEDVPKTAITMGISTILRAEKIVLMASGLNKAEAVKMMIEGEITEDLPGSILQNHKDVIVIIDEDAASLLKK